MPGYRPPSTEPRGKWARAIHRKRRELNLSQQAAFELLHERLGFGPKSRTAYLALDMGTRQPTEAESQVLVDWLGAYPEDDSATGAEKGDTQAAPVAQYLATVNALVEQMAEDRKLMLELLSLVRPTADRAERNSAELRALRAELQSLRARSGSGA